VKIRSTLHLGEKTRALQLYPILSETDDHLLLKLAACVFFYEREPLVISSPQQHPALAGQDFAPDLITADDTNQVTFWVECAKTTLHKLDKVTKRFRDQHRQRGRPHRLRLFARARRRPRDQGDRRLS